MKKLFLLLASSMFICSAFSQSATVNQKSQQAANYRNAAIKCVRSTLKAPSTMKVVSVKQELRKAYIEGDTIEYHVASAFGNYFNAIGGEKYFTHVDSIIVDSIKISEQQVPTYTLCTVKYDAQNSFGAMIRDEQDVIVYQDGTTMTLREFAMLLLDGQKKNSRVVKCEEDLHIKDLPALASGIKEGKWNDNMYIKKSNY